jgi:hypothetical protein
VCQQGSAYSGIVAKELDDLSMTRPCFGPEFNEVSSRQRTKPPPPSSQCVAATIEEKVRSRFAGE